MTVSNLAVIRYFGKNYQYHFLSIDDIVSLTSTNCKFFGAQSQAIDINYGFSLLPYHQTHFSANFSALNENQALDRS